MAASFPEGSINPYNRSITKIYYPVLKLAVVPSIIDASFWIGTQVSRILTPYELQIWITVKAVIVFVKLAICTGALLFSFRKTSLLST